MMVAETWALTIAVYIRGDISSAGLVNASILRMGRMAKLLRMTRIARFLRSMPELMVLIKGIGLASRSVFFCMLLMLIIIYVFAIGLRQLTKGTTLEDSHFDTVPTTMNNLLLDCLLPAGATMVDDVSEESMYLWPVIIFFILLTSLTVMNMLVGVLVNIVNVVTTMEKEGMTVRHVNYELRQAMATLKIDVSQPIPQKKFTELLMAPEIFRIVHDVGVDVVTLVEMSDVIYQELEVEEGSASGMSFSDFIGVVLSMRGSNPAMVKDIKEQLKVIKSVVQESITEMLNQVRIELSKVRLDVADVRSAQKEIGELFDE
eukprot:gnl/TRDRNA2_/TRDRNA2_143921_c1_seq1.p1 gnl/TRDRNA2_/TRDRNA2_143921_c1~~gnl/TRDRNA2_/TRDRNA2_143921_c1_seq1.p1  ORF type:complete len:353 (-),score=83.75 gnl/TRDRNA2_/TRDRNA2_143921_c1_seq1:71-1021(-)